MVQILGWGALFGIIGFGLGRLSSKFFECDTGGSFRERNKAQQQYEMPRDVALSYLIGLEKQEIQIQQDAFKHMAIVNLGALAVSGGILAGDSSLIAFHLLASWMYILALLCILFAMSDVAGRSEKHRKEVLEGVRCISVQNVKIPTKRVGIHIGSKLLMTAVYGFFLAGVGLSLISFFAPTHCTPTEWRNRPDTFMCSVDEASRLMMRGQKSNVKIVDQP